MAMHLEVPEPVCSVVCQQIFEQVNDPATPVTCFISNVVGGDGSSINVPSTIKVVMEHEEKEYW